MPLTRSLKLSEFVDMIADTCKNVNMNDRYGLVLYDLRKDTPLHQIMIIVNFDVIIIAKKYSRSCVMSVKVSHFQIIQHQFGNRQLTIEVFLVRTK